MKITITDDESVLFATIDLPFDIALHQTPSASDDQIMSRAEAKIREALVAAFGLFECDECGAFCPNAAEYFCDTGIACDDCRPEPELTDQEIAEIKADDALSSGYPGRFEDDQETDDADYG